MTRDVIAAPRGTVMVVDDDADIRDVLVTVLEDAGFRVVTAANGLEALARLQEGPLPSVVLLDLMMPVMDGYAFRALQQDDPMLNAIPTLVLTAGAVTPRVEALNTAGIIKKPVGRAALIHVIRRAILAP